MITIKNVEKKFDEETHLKFKDYEFKQGETYVITGPSGCGKSTLLNLIAGIHSVDSGEIIVKSTYQDEKMPQTFELHKMNQHKRDAYRFNNIGYIFQDYKLVDDFTVIDNLQMLNINGKLYSKEDMFKALALTHIEKKHNQKVRNLSGGEKQRVAIARAILKKSNIILADEPTESLNESLSHEIIELLTTVVKKEKKTLIMVTHDNSLVKYFDHHIDVADFLKGGNK